MDSPEAPLIPEDQRNGELLYNADDADTDTEPGSFHKPEAKPGLFVLLLTFSAGISGLLFGYDTGVISATLVSIGDSLSGRNLTSMDKSIITSVTALFALIISPFSSILADKLGRKPVILFADVLFVAGAAIQAQSNSVGLMTLGRSVIGAGVGAASFVTPLYISEVAPASHRGRLVTTNVLFITLGQVIAYIIGWAFSTYGDKATGWRWMVGLGGIPAVLQAVIVLFMPETPRWLVKAGNSAAAKLVIQKVNGGTAASTRNADAVIKEIEIEAREEEEARRLRESNVVGRWKWAGAWHELMSEGKHRRALAIACLLQALQQLCGFNSLMYFSATIFTIIGFKSPTLTSLVVAVTNFVFTLFALGLIDRIGRRRMLLYSIPFMILGLLFSAMGFSISGIGIGDDSEPSDGDSTSGAGIILVSIMVYVASYALGLGNVPWMQSELFPLAVRSVGAGAATAANWGSNFVIGLTFLPMMDAMGAPWTFVFYGIICLAGYVLIWRIYPETAGLSLEEATTLLDRGWGVR